MNTHMLLVVEKPSQKTISQEMSSSQSRVDSLNFKKMLENMRTIISPSSERHRSLNLNYINIVGFLVG